MTIAKEDPRMIIQNPFREFAMNEFTSIIMLSSKRWDVKTWNLSASREGRLFSPLAWQQYKFT